MKILGYEIRRIEPEEPFIIKVSHHVAFDPDNVYIRIIPKPGYQLCEPGEGGEEKGWVMIGGNKVLGVLKDIKLT